MKNTSKGLPLLVLISYTKIILNVHRSLYFERCIYLPTTENIMRDKINSTF